MRQPEGPVDALVASQTDSEEVLREAGLSAGEIEQLRADGVIAYSNTALRKEQFWHPDDIAKAMNTVKGINAEVVVGGDAGIFFEWETFLKKHVPAPPQGFTKNYSWYIAGDTVTQAPAKRKKR